MKSGEIGFSGAKMHQNRKNRAGIDFLMGKTPPSRGFLEKKTPLPFRCGVLHSTGQLRNNPADDAMVKNNPAPHPAGP
jgi:hypothetical protein